MRILLIITLSLFSILVKGQSFPCYINWDKESIKENFQDLSVQNEKYKVVINDSLSFLKISIRGHEKIDAEFELDSLGECQLSKFVYCCSDCSEKHIQEFLGDRYYGWKKLIPNRYVSKRKRKTMMEVFNSNPEVTVLIFERKEWTKKSYKLLIQDPYGTKPAP